MRLARLVVVGDQLDGQLAGLLVAGHLRPEAEVLAGGNVRAGVRRMPAAPVPAAGHVRLAGRVELDRLLAGPANFLVLGRHAGLALRSVGPALGVAAHLGAVEHHVLLHVAAGGRACLFVGRLLGHRWPAEGENRQERNRQYRVSHYLVLSEGMPTAAIRHTAAIILRRIVPASPET